ncbi:Hypothetical protein FKW44_023888 [Caligus rogercresseyi]|uniref:Uncharacterized protein n=1 Tax=Caligus rogercresseyi TaxID=217165 RepID=A0A7T8GPM9_CALRO|nr:Hypothetical protein FKW44_023888 [Caligus rogercresseyi]
MKKKKEEDSSEADKGNRLKIIKESKERILDEEDEEPLKVAESFSEETKNKTDEQTSKEEMPSPVIPKKKRGRKPKYPNPLNLRTRKKMGRKKKLNPVCKVALKISHLKKLSSPVNFLPKVRMLQMMILRKSVDESLNIPDPLNLVSKLRM